MYDAIVVGARCAGSPTAMLLARKGHKVLLVDRATFPSDTMSTHFIQIPGMVRLKRWGLLDSLMATGCPPITMGALDIGGEVLEADFPLHGVPGLVSPRRTVLDKLLVDAAVDAGAELADGVFIDSLLRDGDRVVGVRGHSASGDFEERARIVIGADGRNSVVAEHTSAPMVEDVPSLGCGYYSYWSGVKCPGAEIFLYDDVFSVAFPTHEGLTTVAVAFPPDRFGEIKRDPEGSVLAGADAVGLGPRLREGRREEKLVGLAGLPNFIRRGVGPGWALVGDAAYHKDPTPADGIADAFRGADLLSDAVDAFLSEREPEAQALERYDETHRSTAKPMFDLTVEMSSFSTSPTESATAFLEIAVLHEEEVSSLLPELEPSP